jgi:hypothetical protein
MQYACSCLVQALIMNEFRQKFWDCHRSFVNSGTVPTISVTVPGQSGHVYERTQSLLKCECTYAVVGFRTRLYDMRLEMK